MSITHFLDKRFNWPNKKWRCRHCGSMINQRDPVIVSLRDHEKDPTKFPGAAQAVASQYAERPERKRSRYKTSWCGHGRQDWQEGDPFQEASQLMESSVNLR